MAKKDMIVVDPRKLTKETLLKIVKKLKPDSPPEQSQSKYIITLWADYYDWEGLWSDFSVLYETGNYSDAIVNLPRDHKDNPLPANPAIIESVVIEEREVPARPEWSVLN